MNTTPAQLHLAADILETGHPWETSNSGLTWYETSKNNNPAVHVVNGQQIRPVLATPPYPAQLHNPDNLTAEQVGVGYRLALPEEMDGRFQNGRDKCEWWSRGQGWRSTSQVFVHKCLTDTLRLPLSVPWPEPVDPYAELKAAHAAGKAIQYNCGDERAPEWEDIEDPEFSEKPIEYRIKPEPAFQLPPCAPGMRWHREDLWKPEDLPSGYRPLVDGENWVAGDEILRFDAHGWQIGGAPGDILDEPVHSGTSRCRTTRPLTFEHAGKTWTWHRPGDPMPCDGERFINYLMVVDWPSAGRIPVKASVLNWGEQQDPRHAIIGWRYADEKKTVPLGPEDVPPGSVFRPVGWSSIPNSHVNYEAVVTNGVRPIGKDWGEFCLEYGYLPWLELQSEWQINRSIPLTGKWNPDAWEPCSKEVAV